MLIKKMYKVKFKIYIMPLFERVKIDPQKIIYKNKEIILSQYSNKKEFNILNIDRQYYTILGEMITLTFPYSKIDSCNFRKRLYDILCTNNVYYYINDRLKRIWLTFNDEIEAEKFRYTYKLFNIVNSNRISSSLVDNEFTKKRS